MKARIKTRDAEYQVGGGEYLNAGDTVCIEGREWVLKNRRVIVEKMEDPGGFRYDGKVTKVEPTSEYLVTMVEFEVW